MYGELFFGYLQQPLDIIALRKSARLNLLLQVRGLQRYLKEREETIPRANDVHGTSPW